MKLIRCTILSALALSAALALAEPACAQDKNVEDVLAEGRMRRMTTVLALTDDQKTKVRPVIMEELKESRAAMEDISLTVPQKDAKKKEAREKMNAKLKEMLTPEQYQKFEEMQKPQPKKSKPKPKAE